MSASSINSRRVHCADTANPHTKEAVLVENSNSDVPVVQWTNADRSALGAVLQDLGASFVAMDITDAAPGDIYGFDLILLRPDMHVVWRGNTPPSDPATLAATVTGH
jgi:phosphoribulokinase